MVAYATKKGATARIADLIGDVLRCNGHDVDVLGVTEVRSIEPYDAVVLGSAIYVRRWRLQAMQSSAATLTSPRLGDRHQRRDRRHRVQHLAPAQGAAALACRSWPDTTGHRTPDATVARDLRFRRSRATFAFATLLVAGAGFEPA